MDPKTGRKDAETGPNPGMHSFLDFTLDSRRQVLLRGAESIRLRGRTYQRTELSRDARGTSGQQTRADGVCLGGRGGHGRFAGAVPDGNSPGARRLPGVVKTIRGRGYLFDATVRRVAEDTAQTPAAERSRAEPGDAVSPGDQGDSSLTSHRRFRTTVIVGSLLVVAIAATGAVLYSGQVVRVFSGGPTKQIRSLAVLPLVNLSGDAEQEDLADGITDELIGNLMKIRALRVISRTSVMRFKGTRKPIAEIARELDVDAVVEGAVIRSAERVRVTAKVIQANPEKNLWAERYELPMGDAVTLLGKVANEISQAIRIELTLQEQKGFADARPVDQATYESFLKGRYYWAKRTEAATQRAIEYFQRAIESDPRFALAFTGLADSYISLAVAETLQEAIPPTDAFPKARVAVSRALEVDDSIAEAHASLGHIMFQYDRDWSGAEKEFRRAIELNPSYANAHHWYTLSLMWMGRLDEALKEIRQARAIDPLSLVINSNLGFILAAAHQHALGIEQCRKTLDMDPNFGHAHYRLGQIYVLKGMNQDAIVELKKAIALSGDSPRATAELGLAYARLGDTSEALKLLSELRARSRLRYVSPFNMALIYGGLGDTKQTLDWLEMAYKERSPSLNFLTLSPAFDRLRSEPRFTELVKRIGLPLL